jgi:hypothetical protein
MIKKDVNIQWSNRTIIWGANLKDGEIESVSVDFQLVEGTGDEEKVVKEEKGFSIPVTSPDYATLALTEAEIQELINPSTERAVEN